MILKAFEAVYLPENVNSQGGGGGACVEFEGSTLLLSVERRSHIGHSTARGPGASRLEGWEGDPWLKPLTNLKGKLRSREANGLV